MSVQGKFYVVDAVPEKVKYLLRRRLLLIFFFLLNLCVWSRLCYFCAVSPLYCLLHK